MILGNLRCSFFVSTQIIINLFIASLNEQVFFKDKRTRIGNLYPQTASMSNRQAGAAQECGSYTTPVRLSLSAALISRGTVFFSHSKSATADL
jgi:hypothetical protein